MDANQLRFINQVSGLDAELAAFAAREEDRRAAFDTAMAGLAAKKDEIRAAMDVRLVKPGGGKGREALSGKGQEHDLDTFKATRKGQGLSARDMKQVGLALKPIADAAQALLATKTRTGEPLFATPEEFQAALGDELFSPLVREGVLPENFVLDQYSEVQKLLDATFAGYKARNASQRDDEETAAARSTGKLHGAGTGMEQFGAAMKQLAGAPTRLADKAGIDQKMRRRMGIAKAGAEALKSLYEMGTTIDSWQIDPDSGKPKIETNFAKQLNPDKALYPQADPDDARAQMIEDKRAKSIKKLHLTADEEKHVLAVLGVQENNDFASSKDGILGYGGNVKALIGKIILPAVKLKALEDALGAAHHEAANVDAARKAASAIDAKLVAALDTHFRKAGGAVAGMYAAAVDADEVAEAAAQTRPDDQAIIHAFALGFSKVLTQGLDPALAGAGKTVMAAFVGAADGVALKAALQADPANAFAPLVAATEKMLAATLGALGDDSKRGIAAGALKGLATTVAKQIDATLVAALKDTAGEAAAEAFEGLYAAKVDVNGVVDDALETRPDGAAIVQVFSEAFHAAMVQGSPDASDTAFLKAGKALAAAMKSGVDTARLSTTLAIDPAAAFRTLIAGAEAAIATGLAGATDLAAAVATPEAQRSLAASSAFADDGAKAMEDLEASDAEKKEYERQLVLIDEGGIAAAELHTIEGLIEKLERDKLVAEMIVASGEILTGIAGKTTGIIGQQAVAVTDTLVSEIVGPLKAAKLIVKFAVAMKAANDRRILLQKFSRSLDLAKKAVSPMQSTIQGFFNNKVEQVTFHAIEDALTLIQIAAAVLGSVPEPITLAVGKTLGAAASAGEGVRKVSEMLFNEAMLSKGWSTTLAAIRNPRDRATGLAALKLNPTLGMHAMAWAGMEKTPPDPIARAALAELGLNEQTLEVSGSEAKVRKYLETLLAEDRTLLDPDAISPKWIPQPLALDAESWVVAQHRGATQAEPRLRKGGNPELLVFFKKMLDAQKLSALRAQAASGAIEPATIDGHRADVRRLKELLQDYHPVSSDGAEHDDMVNVVAQWMKLAGEREAELLQIAVANANERARDAVRVGARATAQTDRLAAALALDTREALEPAFDDACLLVREIQIVRMDEDDQVRPLYERLLARTQAAGTALQALAAAALAPAAATPETATAP